MSHEQKLLHDLLNQITVITAQCEVMSDGACKGANKRLAEVVSAAHKMANMIDDYMKNNKLHQLSHVQ